MHLTGLAVMYLSCDAVSCPITRLHVHKTGAYYCVSKPVWVAQAAIQPPLRPGQKRAGGDDTASSSLDLGLLQQLTPLATILPSSLLGQAAAGSLAPMSAQVTD